MGKTCAFVHFFGKGGGEDEGREVREKAGGVFFWF